MVGYYGLFEPDKDGGFVITFPDFGWGASQVETEDEASTMAEDLLKTIIGDHMKQLQPLPRPRKRRGAHYRLVALPALQSAKVELYREFLKSGLRKADLARRVGVAKSNLDRLFDLDHASRLEQIEDAFRALGKRLVVDVKDAA